MKKMLLFTLIILSCISCSNDKEDELSQNPLKDTLWSLNESTIGLFGDKDEYIRYIEFVGNNNVRIWDTYNNTVYSGTYMVYGNTVEFNNLYDRYWRRYYIDGTFTSRSLTVSFSPDAEHTFTHSDTYTKE